MFRRPFGGFYGAAPWQELDRLQREMNRLFATAPQQRMAPGFPAMNVWTNQDGAMITAELPGVNPDDIDISVVGETLTLSGSRQSEELQENDRFHRRERGYGKFTRAFELPFPVEADRVEATFNKGILYVFLPRAEADKPRKISVKAV